MNEFDSFDVINFAGLRLMRAGIVPSEERGKDQAEQALKVQLLFCGCKVSKGENEIISQSDISDLHRFFGDKILTKFKVGEEVFKHLRTLGLNTGSECDWQAIPQIWNIGGNSGIWYRPAALLKIDGKGANYQILKVGKPKRSEMQDAFAYFDNDRTPSFPWSPSPDSELKNLESQINAELEGAAH